MNQLRFKSILNPDKYGYVFTNDSMSFWDQCYRTPNALGGAFGYYETLGDGTTQHTPTAPALSQHFTDYCVSLAQHLIDDPTAEISTHHFTDRITEASVRFLATVTYKEDKRLYFSLEHAKVSSADSKEHDKRWHRVPRWANGTLESAWGLYRITNEHSLNIFKLYQLHDVFWTALYSTPHGDWDRVIKYHEDLPADHRSAFKALRFVIAAREGLWNAARSIKCALANAKLKAEEEAAAAAKESAVAV